LHGRLQEEHQGPEGGGDDGEVAYPGRAEDPAADAVVLLVDDGIFLHVYLEGALLHVSPDPDRRMLAVYAQGVF
jgi:hypothetical protein